MALILDAARELGIRDAQELGQGVPTAAFKTLPGDDKDVATAYRKKNKEDLQHQTQAALDFTPELRGHLEAVLEAWRSLSALPEQTPAQIDAKKERFAAFSQGAHAGLLRAIADIPVAQFYIPKVPGNEATLVTDGEFRGYWRGQLAPQGHGADAARALSEQQRFFHWFLEFPEILEQGGFDCIVGNPPYLGRKNLSGTLGYPMCEYARWKFDPVGLSDLVVFFLRRIHGLLRDGGFTAIITTNSIVDGDVRKDGLEQVVATGAQINLAVRGIKWPGTANLVVSLLALHKGEWNGPRMLDNQPVEMINAFFEEEEGLGAPNSILENHDRVFQGSIFLGDGFLLSHKEAGRLRTSDPRNAEIIMPIINGKELNNEPNQIPGRSIINFRDWPMERAREYPEPFAIIEEKVKPIRATQNRKRNREVWWVYAEHRPGLTRSIRNLPHCFVAVWVTKHLNFSLQPTHIIFSNSCYVFTTDRWDLFTVVQSTVHEVWARKYSGSLETRLRYSPSECFDTFAFPAGLWQTADTGLAELGERYHAHRKALMLSLWLGLTTIYNLFHARDLSPTMVTQVSKKNADTAAAGFEALLELRRLHVQLDLAVRDAYGWQDLDLEHGFYEIETLTENDRVRYTISPAARREVLTRLLTENHARAEAEARKPAPKPKRGSRRDKAAADGADLF